MTVPVFEEYEPAIDCACAGCALRRRTAARAAQPEPVGAVGRAAGRRAQAPPGRCRRGGDHEA
ncbi:hypothetical protein AB0917_27555, partial [Streptomyces sp. NPDC007346]